MDNNKKDLIHYTSNIRPRRCEMVAAWPGVGSVALLLSEYLVEKLEAMPFAVLEPTAFFEATGVLVKDNVVEEPQFPANNFYYWRNPEEAHDLIFFIGEEQPASHSYELANCVLDVAKKYRVRRVHTFAAALVKIHHSEQPKVWAAATEEKMIKELQKFPVVLRGSVQIAGLNGLFLGVAKEREMQGVCLLAEVPAYAQRVPNMKATLAIARVFTQMQNIKVDLKPMEETARDAEKEMGQLASEAMGQFIDSYTTPLWQQDEDEEPDEEEGGGSDE
jgi:proteasome assembly chaperone (PAC2) family protein